MVHLRFATKRGADAWAIVTASGPSRNSAKAHFVELVSVICAGFATARNDVLCMMLVAIRQDVLAAMLDCVQLAALVRD